MIESTRLVRPVDPQTIREGGSGDSDGAIEDPEDNQDEKEEAAARAKR